MWSVAVIGESSVLRVSKPHAWFNSCEAEGDKPQEDGSETTGMKHLNRNKIRRGACAEPISLLTLHEVARKMQHAYITDLMKRLLDHL